ncbi:MAG TPA: patatin family protein [Lachnospiraceae bacterium]|jgi:predicted patatin/cPLA2 family phospholipase|nr:patatin family protein [Lachnospiraceae bacterium]
MKKTTGLLLEGGALRSVFTAGVLDYFMDNDFYVPNVVAVSAGAYAGLNYIAKQRGRTADTNIETFRHRKYVGLKTLLRTGELFDMELLFNEFPNGDKPFDYETFFASDQHFLMSTVNCMTGEPVYYEHFDDKAQLMKIARASNSLPFISKKVDIDGVPMLDGGMYDAIPISKALEEGIEKVIVIFTRTGEYRKKKRHIYMFFLRMIYHKFPEFVKMVESRPQRYNDAIDQIEQLEKDGKAFVIRPTQKPVANNETNPDKLMRFYEHGYECARLQFDQLKKFVEE